MQGETAFKNGRYTEAIQAFGALVEEGYATVPLYYNLANAYAANEQTGPAVLYLEQAYRLAPTNRTVRTRLEAMREEVMDGALEMPPFFLTAWARQLRDMLSANVWAILCLFAFAGLIYGIGQWRFAEARPARKRGFSMGVVALCLLFPMAWLAVERQAVERASGVYVVLQPNQPLREAPAEEARRVATLPEGYRLERTDQLDTWIQVTTPTGTQGWVSTESGIVEVR